MPQGHRRYQAKDRRTREGKPENTSRESKRLKIKAGAKGRMVSLIRKTLASRETDGVECALSALRFMVKRVLRRRNWGWLAVPLVSAYRFVLLDCLVPVLCRQI